MIVQEIANVVGVRFHPDPKNEFGGREWNLAPTEFKLIYTYKQ